MHGRNGGPRCVSQIRTARKVARTTKRRIAPPSESLANGEASGWPCEGDGRTARSHPIHIDGCFPHIIGILVAKGARVTIRLPIADPSSVQSVHASVENLDASWPVDIQMRKHHYGI
jgi:hypothetical protein